MPAWSHETSHLFLTLDDVAKAPLVEEDTGGEMFREVVHKENIIIC